MRFKGTHINNLIMQTIVINLPNNVGRRERIEDRLEKQGLKEHYHLLTVNDDSEECKNFIQGVESQCDSRQLRVLCSLLSHIQAYRYFYNESKCDECIIMEDDAMLRKDFKKGIRKLIKQKPATYGCILLAPYLTIGLSQKEKLSQNLYRHFSQSIFGASCYWINRDFAKRVLDRYDKPLRDYSDFSPHLTSETVLYTMNSCVSYPPLAIEESLDTNLQWQSHLKNKLHYWSQYGLENYE
jgi:GR25 family glycosyltransferase involved in LPS biosynthesis